MNCANIKGILGIVAVGSIVVNFEDVDLSKFQHKQASSGERVWRLPITVFIRLGAREGTFTFRTTIAGKECGEAEIEFD